MNEKEILFKAMKRLAVQQIGIKSAGQLHDEGILTFEELDARIASYHRAEDEIKLLTLEILGYSHGWLNAIEGHKMVSNILNYCASTGTNIKNVTMEEIEKQYGKIL